MLYHQACAFSRAKPFLTGIVGLAPHLLDNPIKDGIAVAELDDLEMALKLDLFQTAKEEDIQSRSLMTWRWRSNSDSDHVPSIISYAEAASSSLAPSFCVMRAICL